MKISDYFTNDFEAHDSHHIPSLVTRYYRATKEKARIALLSLIESEKAKIIDDNENYSEILFETSDYSCICTLSNPRTMGETAIDLKVTTNAILPLGKGKKIIERLYKYFDSQLTFVACGACRG